MRRTNIVVIGGGTGTYTILSGLKHIKNLNLSVIVSMMDDGGSNKILRDEFGLLPTSDIRQCIVALTPNSTNEILRNLFTYRYKNGQGISGMTFGNLFMAALSDIYKNDQRKAIEKTCEVLNIIGKVIPVTYDKTNLVAKYKNGKTLVGQHNIDEPKFSAKNNPILSLYVKPNAQANIDATKAINEADYVILGPGDLYTSIIPNLLINNLKVALKSFNGKLIYVLNLMTKYGQTDGFGSSKFVGELEKYLGGRKIDYCIMNNSSKIPDNILKNYKIENAELVRNDFDLKNITFKLIKGNLISKVPYIKPKSDKLVRSLVRHDSLKLARCIKNIINNER